MASLFNASTKQRQQPISATESTICSGIQIGYWMKRLQLVYTIIKKKYYIDGAKSVCILLVVDDQKAFIRCACFVYSTHIIVLSYIFHRPARESCLSYYTVFSRSFCNNIVYYDCIINELLVITQTTYVLFGLINTIHIILLN